MPHYFANFQQVASHDFRFDTRIYLDPNAHPGPKDRCIAAVIAKNPGSASPLSGIYNKLAPLHLGKDKTLPTIKNRFVDAYRLAKKTPPINGYVIVWNLFYLCDKDLPSAIKSYQSIPTPPHPCDTESSLSPNIIWYAWGGASDSFLNTLKGRFKQLPKIPFYYDYGVGKILDGIPSEIDRVKHPQRMPLGHVEDFLAEHL